MKIETFIGIAASACTAASLIPQLVKVVVVKDKEAESISLLMLLILFIGIGLWIYYGALKNDLIIIISNACSFLINTTLAIFSIKYKKK